MIAISAALAFGPPMDAARSPERRVKMKLTTRTVRHTKAASHSLRTINKTIADNYDSEPVTASSDVEPLQWRHRNLPVFSAYARNMFANMPKPTAATAALNVYELRGSSRKLVRNRRRDTAGNACQTLVAGKIAGAGGVQRRQRQHVRRLFRGKGAVMSLVGTFRKWRDVRLESVKRSRADIAQALRF